jgi:hypothetical protein
MAHETDNYWFAGSAGRCGTGRAVAWQGWLVSAIYGLVVTAAAIGLAERTVIGFVSVVLIATALLLVVCNAKTPGGLCGRGQPGRRR